MARSLNFDEVADRYDATRGGEQRGAAVAEALDPWLPRQGTILEVGVGTGVVAAALVAGGRDVVGLDISAAMLARASSRLLGAADTARGRELRPEGEGGGLVAQGDAEVLPVRSGSVAAVYAVWVLHLVGDLGAVVGEAARAVEPDGRVVFVCGQPRHGGDVLSAAEARLWRLRPRGDEPEDVVPLAAAAGLVEVGRAGIRQEYLDTPEAMARRVEERLHSFVFDVDDATWAAEVQPVVDALRAMPEPARPIRRTGAHHVLVFERA